MILYCSSVFVSHTDVIDFFYSGSLSQQSTESSLDSEELAAVENEQHWSELYWYWYKVVTDPALNVIQIPT